MSSWSLPCYTLRTGTFLSLLPPSLSHTGWTSFFLVMAVPSLTKAEECGYE